MKRPYVILENSTTKISVLTIYFKANADEVFAIDIYYGGKLFLLVSGEDVVNMRGNIKGKIHYD